MTKKWLAAGSLAAGLLGIFLTTDGLYIKAKAELAQVLLAKAWQETQAGSSAAKPWPWADMWPAFELSVPRLGQSTIVLSGTSGEAMSFGPGWMETTATPGAPGMAVIAAHRDTHFEFLKDVAKGDVVAIAHPNGMRQNFEVTDMRVVDAAASGLNRHIAGSWLALSTCWPSDGARRTQQRYVVLARLIT